MEELEVKFKDLSFKDKILSVAMTIALIIGYLLMLVFMFRSNSVTE